MSVLYYLYSLVLCLSRRINALLKQPDISSFYPKITFNLLNLYILYLQSKANEQCRNNDALSEHKGF